MPKAKKAFYCFLGLLLLASVVDLLMWAYRYIPILYAKISGTLCRCEGERDGLIFVIVALTIITLSASGSILTGLNYCVWFNSPPTERWSKFIVVAKGFVGVHLLLLLLRFVAGY